jgi:cytochrome c
MKKLIWLTCVLGMIFLFACQKENNVKQEGPDRPHDPWVFRSVLDTQARMITIALHKDVWLAYNTENASLYKVWKGVVNFEGAVYNHAHGPQPTTVGDTYFTNLYKKPWTLKKNGSVVPSDVQYKGHKFVNGEVELLYQIKETGTDNYIDITEKPSYSKEDNNNYLVRRFVTSGQDPAYTIEFATNAASIITKSQYEASDNFSFTSEKKYPYKDKEFLAVEGVLTLPLGSIETIKTRIIQASYPDPNIEEAFDTKDSSLPPGALLIAKNDCKTCHNKVKKTIGPSYTAIAKKYEHNDANIAMLTSKIKLGGSGIWGQQVMTPHPEIPKADIKEMINYIFSIADFEGVSASIQEISTLESPSDEINVEELLPGIVTSIYKIPLGTDKMPNNIESKQAIMAGIMPNYDNVNGGDFSELEDNFALVGNGYLSIPEDGIYDMRIWSDDGSRVTLNGKIILDNDGLHGTEMKETRLGLKKGYHPFKVEFFQGSGGKFLGWNYKPENDEFWSVIPTQLLFHHKDQQGVVGKLSLPMSVVTKIPGDKYNVAGVHPAFTLSQARPDDFQPKVGGMDFLPDGRMVVSTWDAIGGIYLVDGVQSSDPSKMSVKQIASGIAEPLGVKVVDGEIYIMQKQEITHLIDNNNDDIIDEYRTLCNDWGVSANFHEFGFGLEEKDGYLYANLATGIQPGGAGVKVQPKDRGSSIRVNIKTGEMEIVANGLRTPNGIGLGFNDELFIADNQGDWLPASKIVQVSPGAWYGSRAVDFEGTAGRNETLPLVWLPQDEIGNSPSTPSYLNVGPYKNQMIHGEVTHGGVKRVFVEDIEGDLQGCVFRFIQGIEAGVNRIKWGPDGAMYVGGIGNPGNWQQTGKLWYGLQRLEYNENSVFEMLAIRAKSNGVEIELTEALKENEGWEKSDYEVKQWYYKPTADYGGPKLDEKELAIQSVSVSDDRKKIFLELDGMKENHVVYVRLNNNFVSAEGNSLWAKEGWYTMNKIPKNTPGKILAAKTPKDHNSLYASEAAAGWKLLFDGETMDSWKGFKKDKVSEKWKIVNGELHFDPTIEGDGGDIMSKEEYENFELALEWKIQNCGNSGIFFNVVEDEKYCCTFSTGVEMQILDNTCHPDTRFPTHRAGDLYDMIACKYVTVKPAGQWNKVKIISNQGKVQFWLNGYEVVDFEMHNEEWSKMIAGSKFATWDGFGVAKKGHIALQDHGDKVWFRNIMIREL